MVCAKPEKGCKHLLRLPKQSISLHQPLFLHSRFPLSYSRLRVDKPFLVTETDFLRQKRLLFVL